MKQIYPNTRNADRISHHLKLFHLTGIKKYAGYLLAVLIICSSFVRTEAQTGSLSEKEQCKENLHKIHQAIQAYRKDHKELPQWLSELIPGYLAPKYLRCPVSLGDGKSNVPSELEDPHIKTTYQYQFSPTIIRGVWGNRTMREWKQLQMGLVGGVVPIVRCPLHPTFINLGFDGNIYESKSSWENTLADFIQVKTLSPEALFSTEQSGKMGGNIDHPILATPAIEDAIERVEVQPSDRWVGVQAPEIQLPLMSGGLFESAPSKNKQVVLIHFWTTWCPPCKRSLAMLSKIASEYATKGVVTVGINIRENKELIKAFLKREGIQILPAIDADGKIAQVYGVEDIPTTVVLDRYGIIQAYYVGYKSDMAETIHPLLDSLCSGLSSVEPMDFKLNIPKRDLNAQPQLVDLSRHYNASLTQSWYSKIEGDDLVNLPRGIQLFESISFDIRGIIQLSGKSLQNSSDRSFPEQIGRMLVNQRAKQIHILHGVTGTEAEGTKVGQLVLNYANGEKVELPICYGSEVCDWQGKADANNEQKNARIAWSGKTSSGKTARIFLTSWKNPRSDLEIGYISYVSEMRNAAPFLLGITVEP